MIFLKLNKSISKHTQFITFYSALLTRIISSNRAVDYDIPVCRCFKSSFKAAVASVASPLIRPNAHNAKKPC